MGFQFRRLFSHGFPQGFRLAALGFHRYPVPSFRLFLFLLWVSPGVCLCSVCFTLGFPQVSWSPTYDYTVCFLAFCKLSCMVIDSYAIGVLAFGKSYAWRIMDNLQGTLLFACHHAWLLQVITHGKLWTYCILPCILQGTCMVLVQVSRGFLKGAGGFLQVACGFRMDFLHVSVQVSGGFPVGFPWVSNFFVGFPAGSVAYGGFQRRFPCGFPVGFLQTPRGLPVISGVSLRVSNGFHAGFLQVS